MIFVPVLRALKILYMKLFPSRKMGGGYQLLKCISNICQLEPLSGLVMESSLKHKQRVGTANRRMGVQVVPMYKLLMKAHIFSIHTFGTPKFCTVAIVYLY